MKISPLPKCVIIAAVIALLPGCSGQSQAEDAVRQILKDPDSAKFGAFQVVDGTEPQQACLVVNARNSMGGYTGDQVAALEKRDGEWQTFGILDMSLDRCVDAARSVSGKK